MVDPRTLTISWTRAAADRQRALFRWVFGLVLAAESVLAIALLLWPAWMTSLTVWPALGATLWVRGIGAFWLAINLFQLPGWFDPIYQRWPYIVGLPWRFVIAIFCAFLGGYAWTLVIGEVAAAIGLSLLYWWALRSELLCRP